MPLVTPIPRRFSTHRLAWFDIKQEGETLNFSVSEPTKMQETSETSKTTEGKPVVVTITRTNVHADKIFVDVNVPTEAGTALGASRPSSSGSNPVGAAAPTTTVPVTCVKGLLELARRIITRAKNLFAVKQGDSPSFSLSDATKMQETWETSKMTEALPVITITGTNVTANTIIVNVNVPTEVGTASGASDPSSSCDIKQEGEMPSFSISDAPKMQETLETSKMTEFSPVTITITGTNLSAGLIFVNVNVQL